jgi:hypothetical protein
MTLAELYLEAARASKMEEKYPDLCLIKYKGYNYKAKSLICYGNWKESLDKTEFALAVVEGKPVFKGDVLYYNSGVKIIADIKEEFGDDLVYDKLTWNPPKPKTVMVELLVEDAQYIISSKWYHQEHEKKIKEACLKALGELK